MLSGLRLAGSICGFLGDHTSDTMRTYYFDVIDGVPIRDRHGLEFLATSGAIEHSKDLARRIRADPRCKGSSLSIVVLDESGTEIHREPVYPDKAESVMALGSIG